MIDAAAFKSAVGRFATGVTVVTAQSATTVHGMTANAFTSVSLDPPLVLVNVARSARMHGVLSDAGAFTVNVLAEDQAWLASWFAHPDRPRGRSQFAEIAVRPAVHSGAPLLEGALAHLDCTVHDVLPGGDHDVVLGRVVDLAKGPPARPLLYFEGRYGRWGPELD